MFPFNFVNNFKDLLASPVVTCFNFFSIWHFKSSYDKIATPPVLLFQIVWKNFDLHLVNKLLHGYKHLSVWYSLTRSLNSFILVLTLLKFVCKTFSPFFINSSHFLVLLWLSCWALSLFMPDLTLCSLKKTLVSYVRPTKFTSYPDIQTHVHNAVFFASRENFHAPHSKAWFVKS